MTGTALLSVRDLAAGHGGEAPVLAGLDFDVPAGECLAVVGRSGCGKSTLLHVLAGLLAPEQGSATVGGEAVAAARWPGTDAPGCRAGHAAYMFQDDLLLPWKSALDNATFAARAAARGTLARGDRAALEERARGLLKEFGLGDALLALPSELSGGMRQRVALARTLLMDRALVLLDEPFGSLDAVTRSEMRRWLLEVMEAHPATWILVTHDVEEAVLLGDHVAVLHGRPARLVAWADATLSHAQRLALASPLCGGDGPSSGDADGAATRLAAAAAALTRALAVDVAA